MTKDNLQWHPAFFAGMQIEFEQEADMLIFENERKKTGSASALPELFTLRIPRSGFRG